MSLRGRGFALIWGSNFSRLLGVLNDTLQKSKEGNMQRSFLSFSLRKIEANLNKKNTQDEESRSELEFKKFFFKHNKFKHKKHKYKKIRLEKANSNFIVI